MQYLLLFIPATKIDTLDTLEWGMYLLSNKDIKEVSKYY